MSNPIGESKVGGHVLLDPPESLLAQPEILNTQLSILTAAEDRQLRVRYKLGTLRERLRIGGESAISELATLNATIEALRGLGRIAFLTKLLSLQDPESADIDLSQRGFVDDVADLHLEFGFPRTTHPDLYALANYCSETFGWNQHGLLPEPDQYKTTTTHNGEINALNGKDSARTKFGSASVIDSFRERRIDFLALLENRESGLSIGARYVHLPGDMGGDKPKEQRWSWLWRDPLLPDVEKKFAGVLISKLATYHFFTLGQATNTQTGETSIALDHRLITPDGLDKTPENYEDGIYHQLSTAERMFFQHGIPPNKEGYGFAENITGFSWGPTRRSSNG